MALPGTLALTEFEIRTAKAVEKPLKLFDGGGLFLLVNPNGRRWWRFKYRYEGKERGIPSASTMPFVRAQTLPFRAVH